MRALVTGSSGMIGKKVVELLEGTCDIVTADKKDGQDLTDFSLCKELTKGVDQLYHIAGVKGSGKMTRERPADFFVPMIQMTTNILEAARLNGVKKILYVSSTAVTHDEFPGFAKEAGEKQLEAYKIQYGFDSWVVIRPNSVYGEYDNFDPDDGMFIPALMAKIKRGDNPVIIYSPDSIRDFTYSEDVARVCLFAMEELTGCYDFGGEPRFVKDVVNILREYVDFDFIYDWNKKDIRRAEFFPWPLDFTPLERGIEKTWKWYLQN